MTLRWTNPASSFYPGILGTGPPLSVGSGNRLRELRDGCGKCSLGRWGLSDRNFPTTDSWERVSGLIWQAASDWSSNTLLRDLALGTIIASPFDPLKVDALRAELEGFVGSLGAPLKSHPADRVEGTLHWRLFSSLLQLAVDPDTEAIGEFSLRVTLGVDCVLPRVPAIYDRKVRWCGEILGEAERDPAFAREDVKDQLNYVSAAAPFSRGFGKSLRPTSN